MIGVEITDPGAGYFTTPPLITFEDPCNLGYGAVGEATVDFNPDSPTYGQIVNVNILSGGENYPTSPSDEGDAINSDSIPFGVTDTNIINTGSGYEDAVVRDDNDTEYDVIIQNGRIIDAKPLNNIKIENIPIISITSKTGSGASLKPIIGRLDHNPNIYLATMHSGITLGPLVGSLVARELVQDIKIPVLENFRPSRFD